MAKSAREDVYGWQGWCYREQRIYFKKEFVKGKAREF